MRSRESDKIEVPNLAPCGGSGLINENESVLTTCINQRIRIIDPEMHGSIARTLDFSDRFWFLPYFRQIDSLMGLIGSIHLRVDI